MAKKNFKTPEMENLLNGLANGKSEGSLKERAAKEDAPKTSEGKYTKKQKVSKEHLCTLVPTDLLGKVRELKYKEGLRVSQIVTVALTNLINSYEDKYGPLKTKEQKHGKIDVLLDL